MNSYSHFFLLLFSVASFFLVAHSSSDPNTSLKSGTEKVVFTSTDGGQTWQDISRGLPENFRKDGVSGNTIYANDKGLFLKEGNELYHYTPTAATQLWTKEVLTGKQTSIESDKSGIVHYNYYGVNLKKTNGTNMWSQLFENVDEPRLRSAFETANGTVFFATNRGFFKSADDGKSWKHVHNGAYAGHVAESNGVLVAISMKKIIRSTDNGETWQSTSLEDSVAFDVKPIEGGFIAITASAEFKNRRLSTSYDGGKSWQLLDGKTHSRDFVESVWRTWDERPNLKGYVNSITRIGQNFFSIGNKGIFRSTDNGKTWTFLLPYVDDKVFNLFVSGNVIYAILSKRGC